MGLQRVVNVVRHLRDDEQYGTKGSRSQRQNAAQDEVGFRGPDCNVIAEQGGGPDARPSWAGSGPRAGGCPPMVYDDTDVLYKSSYYSIVPGEFNAQVVKQTNQSESVIGAFGLFAKNGRRCTLVIWATSGK